MSKKRLTLTKSESTFMVPAKDLLAVWNTVSKDTHRRNYLRGAFIEEDAIGTITLVATDGAVLLKKEAPKGAFMGSKVHTQSTEHGRGFILKTDVMEKAFKAKPVGDLWVHGDIETGILQLLDVCDPEGPVEGETFERLGVCEFEQIDGNFPAYRRVLAQGTKGHAGSEYLSFNPDLIVPFQKAGKILSHTKSIGLRLEAKNPADTVKVLFEQVPTMEGAFMSRRWSA